MLDGYSLRPCRRYFYLFWRKTRSQAMPIGSTNAASAHKARSRSETIEEYYVGVAHARFLAGRGAGNNSADFTIR